MAIWQVSAYFADRHGPQSVLTGVTVLSYIAENLKVLIWQSKSDAGQSYPEDIDYIAQRCQMYPGRFRDILLDKATVSMQEESALQHFFANLGYDAYAISYDFLYADVVDQFKQDLLDKNIRYLLSSLKHGQGKDFAEAMGVNITTVTRWKNGITKPDRYVLPQIARYYGFPDVNFLKSSFLFLDLLPASTQQKKDACINLICEMGREDFEALYPAIMKLLG